MGYDDGIRDLTELECWELLEANDLARLAVSVGDRPDIYPITYVSHGGKLYLRTLHGSKLLGLVINNHVAVEVDQVAEDTGRSVVVHGHARRLESDAEVQAASELPLRSRLDIEDPVYVEITPDEISGRAFHFTRPDA